MKIKRIPLSKATHAFADAITLPVDVCYDSGEKYKNGEMVSVIDGEYLILYAEETYGQYIRAAADPKRKGWLRGTHHARHYSERWHRHLWWRIKLSSK